jgi:GNAT superfamily N-acetyltransferase
MSPTIRAFDPADYGPLVDLWNRIEPERPTTVREKRFQDEHRDPRVLHGRLLAEAGGELIGHAHYGQPVEMLHPGHFWLSLAVREDWRRRGVGKGLFQALLAVLQPLGATELRMEAQEDRPAALAFLRGLGFVEHMREWESRLDLRLWEAERFREQTERVKAQGLQILTYPELAEDPECRRKLHALQTQIEADVPGVDAPTPTDFRVWERKLLANPAFVPEGWAVALDHGRYVGFTSLWRPELGGYLDTGYTGVLREYRRRGLAFALKVHSLRGAQGTGALEARTWNATTNEGMLAINARLGFVRRPAWIFFKRPFAL